MDPIQELIIEFENLRDKINSAEISHYQENRETFNKLKNLLIETGLNSLLITIDYHEKFFTPPTDAQRNFGNPEESFKDEQGKLASLCTKAIRKIKESLQNPPTPKVVVEYEKIYPPTSWRLLRNGLFWTIFSVFISLLSLAFYNLGQNSKEKENAELVNQNAKSESELKEMKQSYDELTLELKNCNEELQKLPSNTSSKK